MEKYLNNEMEEKTKIVWVLFCRTCWHSIWAFLFKNVEHWMSPLSKVWKYLVVYCIGNCWKNKLYFVSWNIGIDTTWQSYFVRPVTKMSSHIKNCEARYVRQHIYLVVDIIERALTAGEINLKKYCKNGHRNRQKMGPFYFLRTVCNP